MTLALLTLLFSPMALAGAPEPVAIAKADAKQIAGSWLDEGGARYVIRRKGKRVWVESIVDSDGEVFEILEHRDESEFTFVYRVPSTDYVVTIAVLSSDDDALQTAWQNAHAKGIETFRRTE